MTALHSLSHASEVLVCFVEACFASHLALKFFFYDLVDFFELQGEVETDLPSAGSAARLELSRSKARNREPLPGLLPECRAIFCFPGAVTGS